MDKIRGSGDSSNKRIDNQPDAGVFSVEGEKKVVEQRDKGVSSLSAKHVPIDLKEEAHLLGREAVSPKDQVLGSPELLSHILGYLNEEDLISVALVNKDMGEITQGYLGSAEGKFREARHHEERGDFGKAAMIYARYAASYPPARERLEAFCLALKVFSTEYHELTVPEIRSKSPSELNKFTADVLRDLKNSSNQELISRWTSYVADKSIPLKERKEVLTLFFKIAFPLLDSEAKKYFVSNFIDQVVERLHLPEGQDYREMFGVLCNAMCLADDVGVQSEAMSALKQKIDTLFAVRGFGAEINLRGDPARREGLVSMALTLISSIKEHSDRVDALENVFGLVLHGEMTVGEAGRAMLAMESLPGLLLEMAGKAKSEAEAKFIVEVVQHVLASNFPDVTMDQKAALMMPLITLMPKMKTPEMRAFIVSVFDSQMNASMAYKLAKGVAEVFMAFVGTVGDLGDVTEHLFEGEVDARVGKHFAKLLPHIDIDTWTSAGAGYYVALGLEHVGAYLDTLPAGPERNREEARIVAFAEGIVNDFNGRSDTLRKAASVALNTIAQKTTDPNVMRGQSYLDALPKVGGIDLDALD